MIIVKVNGGLGNQMFQYAAGRSMSLRSSAELYLETSSFLSQAVGDTQRRFELDLFKIEAKAAPRVLVPFLKESSVLNRAIKKIWSTQFQEVREKQDFVFDPTLFHGINPNSMVIGYWQSFRYFDSIQTELRNEFQPKAQPNDLNRSLIEELKSEEFVSIHVRRGDYLSNPSAAKFHGACGLDYYRSAIERLQERVSIKKALVFSDDPAWCEANLKLPWQARFVSHNQGKNAYWDLHLMSLCRAHIIANSSFSWWGAYLAGLDSHAVVAPQRWTLAIQSDYADLLPEHWIKI